MRQISVYFFVALAFLLSACDKQSWYDYGNGKVNLSQVSIIRPALEYNFEDDSDDVREMNKDYKEALSSQSIERLLPMLSQEEIVSKEYYRIKFEAYVMFDAFKLQLFESKEYIKLPSKYQVTDYMISNLADRGLDQNGQAALDSLKPQVFTSKEAFLKGIKTTGYFNMESNGVLEEFPILALGEKGAEFYRANFNKKNAVLLIPTEIEKLRTGLKESLAQYQAIPAK